jgi:hypothetical protein
MIALSWTAWGGLIVGMVLCAALLFVAAPRQRLTLIALIVAGGIGAITVVLFYQAQWDGTIDQLIAKFLWRTSNQSFGENSATFTAGEYASRMALRLITLYTPTVCVLALMGLLYSRRMTAHGRAVIFGLALGALAFMAVFRNAGFVHDYYLIYLAPALGLFAGHGIITGWTRRATQRWLRPLITAMILFTPVFTIPYWSALYAGSDPTLPLQLARGVAANTEIDALIVSDLPTIGVTIDFYADRGIAWGRPFSVAQAELDDPDSTRPVYVVTCQNSDYIPATTPMLRVTPLIPSCALVKLR